MTLEEIDKAIAALQQQRRELLRSQSQQSFPCSAVTDNPLAVIVGGGGQLGRLFLSLLDRSGFQTAVVDKRDWPNSADQFSKAVLVLIAVPIHATLEVIAQLPTLRSDCILADITSIKAKPMTAMMAKHSGPVVGLHPMFGPDVPSFEKQTIIICEGQNPEGYQWFLQQLQQWGAVLRMTQASTHDKAMAIIQVMRHFSTVAYGQHLMQEETDLREVTELSSPIYRLELAMVGRLFAQDPHLYTDIIFSDLDNVKMMRRYLERFDSLLNYVEAEDKEGFIRSFNAISDWFGEYAQQFLKESASMLTYNKD